MSKGGRNDYPGSSNSSSRSLGPVGQAAQAVCLAAMGPQPNQSWQEAANSWCRRVGESADAAVNHRDSHSVDTVGNVGHWDSGFRTYDPYSTSNNHQD